MARNDPSYLPNIFHLMWNHFRYIVRPNRSRRSCTRPFYDSNQPLHCITCTDFVKNSTSQQRAETLKRDLDDLMQSWTKVISPVKEMKDTLDKSVDDVKQWQVCLMI
ncbi:uncharacterized protein [Ptychodera flava]|uniref:uncharacterized protein n=1 Tax=Ptychodera flava TaxID=63121 RepID=UPI00396A8286